MLVPVKLLNLTEKGAAGIEPDPRIGKNWNPAPIVIALLLGSSLLTNVAWKIGVGI